MVDPRATPWRVLEDPADATVRSAGAAGEAPDRPGRVPPSAVLAGGVAVLLAVSAFALAVGSGSDGAVSIEGGMPLESAPASAIGGVPPIAAQPGGILVVEIVGAVEQPGVFRLPAGSRVGDLVAAAGGYGPRVDADGAGRSLNLAAALKDGDQIRVPSRDDVAAPSAAPAGGSGKGAGGSAAAGPIDLNQATESELDTLPGIGPVTAGKIVASRDEQPFAAIEDLRTRKLVGEKTYASLKDLVTVR
jgi:competence protein ComEA